MYFVITALDYENQLEKRLANRETHLVELKAAIKKGLIISAGAITNDNGDMIGSSIHANFESRDELDQWLANEPYARNGVWESVDIRTINLVDTESIKAN